MSKVTLNAFLLLSLVLCCSVSAGLAYTVDGYVRDGAGNPIQGVRVNKGCDVGGWTETDASGHWVIGGILASSCIFTPEKAGYFFDPPSQTIPGSATNVNFTGYSSGPPYTVTGYVRDGAGNPIQGVRVNKGCDVGGWTETDASGHWVIGGILASSCTFTPTKTGYTFDPPSRTISGCATGVDFAGSCGPPYTVDGYVRDGAGNPIQGVRVNKGCDVGGWTETDASGHWVIGGILASSCTFTPTKTGYTFDPPSRTISGCATGVDFAGSCGPPYTVDGYIRDGAGNPIQGVRVNKGCDVGGWTETDASGHWVIGGILASSCTFTPTKTGYTFDPPSRTISGCTTGVDFAGSCGPPYTVDGYIRDAAGNPIPGVKVNKGCDDGGWTLTDASGHWVIGTISAASCTFTPEKVGYTFNPPSRTISGCATGVDFVGSCGPPYTVDGYIRDAAGNPIPGVKVNKGCDDGGWTLTDASGHWVIGTISAASCTFTPEKVGYTFNPPSRTISGCATGVDFVGSCGPPYTVDGYIRDGAGNPIQGVRVNKGCDDGGWTETDASGHWVIGTISAASCTFTPEKVGYTFNPPSRTISGCATGVDFVGSCGPPYTVDGYIRDGAGNPIQGVRVNKGCDDGGWTETDASGHWVIGTISAASCTFTPTKVGYSFLPPSRTIQGCSGSADFHAIGIPASVETPANQPHTPDVFGFDGNTPEPFSTWTDIRFGLPRACFVQLDVFDLSGRRVASLVSGPQSAGFQVVHWNAVASDGQLVPSGIYFCRLQAGDFAATRRITLLR